MRLRTSITVDLWNPEIPPYLNVKQGDSNREIAVTLTAGGAQINPEVTPNVYIKKPDGTKIYNACSMEGAVVIVPITTQAVAVSGNAQVELQMVDTDGTLSTPICTLRILPTNIDASAIESSNEFKVFEQGLQDLDELKETGLKGDAATIQVGTVTTGEPGTDAEVENSGTEGDAVFDFTIPRGNTGNGINSAAVAVEYQASDSGTVIPTGEWSTIIPEVAAGSYLWTRITMPYTDGTNTVSYSIAKMGDTGATGAKGDQGEKGNTGATGPHYTPSVSADGTLSWENNGGLENPDPVNIKGPKGDPGSTEVDMDMVVTYDTPETYTAPASGNTLATWLGRAAKGLADLFIAVAAKLSKSSVLDDYASVMSNQTTGFWVDALAVKAGFNAKANTSHTHTKSQITDFAHTHDDRYYTESEINSKISALNTSITAAQNTANAAMPKAGGTFTGYVNLNYSPRTLYGGSYLTMPYNRNNHPVSFEWVNSPEEGVGIKMYVDSTAVVFIEKNIF